MKAKLSGLLVLAAIGVAAYAAQAGMKLVLNGKTASSDVRVINGKAYVPINDVAAALGMKVTKTGTTYAMAPAGGAGQIANKNTGRMGEEIFTGKWRFTVLDMQETQTYKPTLSSDKDVIEAGEGQKIVVVSCRVKNGTKVKDELVFSKDWEGTNNALTDADEQSHQPVFFDVLASETAPVGVVFLPGAAINFKVVFVVPSATVPKDLIFTALRYSMRSGYDQKKEPPQDIRVSLSK